MRKKKAPNAKPPGTDIMKRICWLYEQNGMSQNEFAEKIFVSQPTVSKFKTGYRMPSLILLLGTAKLFNVSLDWLVFGELKGENWMKKFKIGDADIYSNLPDIDEDEARRYLDYVNEHGNFNHNNYQVSEIYVEACDDGKVDVDFVLKSVRKFERIRRITG